MKKYLVPFLLLAVSCSNAAINQDSLSRVGSTKSQAIGYSEDLETLAGESATVGNNGDVTQSNTADVSTRKRVIFHSHKDDNKVIGVMNINTNIFYGCMEYIYVEPNREGHKHRDIHGVSCDYNIFENGFLDDEETVLAGWSLKPGDRSAIQDYDDFDDGYEFTGDLHLYAILGVKQHDYVTLRFMLCGGMTKENKAELDKNKPSLGSPNYSELPQYIDIRIDKKYQWHWTMEEIFGKNNLPVWRDDSKHLYGFQHKGSQYIFHKTVSFNIYEVEEWMEKDSGIPILNLKWFDNYVDPADADPQDDTKDRALL